ncbi:MAG: peptidoglycan editing factor PgeF [Bacteroidales bacterium]|jgi:YfiH family protein|nr:peptidoglycan editing factor PgeF [Bacteroidales bacterium]
MFSPILRSKNGICYVEFVAAKHGIAGVSTRKGGVSTGDYESLNMGLNTGDNPAQVAENRRRLFETVAPACTVAYCTQTHSSIVHRVDNTFTNGCEGDALYTTEPNTLLSITTADCGGILLHDTDFSIVAAIHCGWRGLHTGIIEKTVHELSAFVNPNDLTAYIAPCIHPQHYEVGAEFFDFFPAEYILSNNKQYFFNIPQYAANALRFAHVGQVIDTELDTYSQSEYFFSYRRSAITGRMSIFVGILS